ncbi:plasmid mobilization relaxosome protein MobC [Nitratireductor sp.]|uniref:plasmid mobilization protein n=1 Tax=Nitratireductor sp. TaxID=1872084 RepID=UPI00260B50C0|nr:plasmid mobilization relaxosome protein MobC [Nitratireductor sp.]MCV0381727.1 MobC family plasmid mobilization relaxosome protein [Nitratireductor sp.]
MARPKKQPADRRTISLSCRLTEAERLIIEQAAIRAGLSASDYVRKQLLTGKVIVRENRSLDHAAYDQLRRIGVNLNQLTRIANRTGNLPRELASLTAEIERLIVREIAPGASADKGSRRSPLGD